MSPVSEEGEPPRWRGQGDPTPAPDPAPGACPCAAAPATASRPGLGKALLASIWGQIPQPGALLIPCGQRTSRMADTGGCGQLSCPTRGKSGHPPLPSPTTSQQAPNLPRFPITIRLSKKTPHPSHLHQPCLKQQKKGKNTHIPLQPTTILRGDQSPRHELRLISRGFAAGEKMNKCIHHRVHQVAAGLGGPGAAPPGSGLAQVFGTDSGLVKPHRQP